MNTEATTRRPRGMAARVWPVVLAAGLLGATDAAAQAPRQPDPRVGLKAGFMDAGEAARNMELVGHHNKAPGFSNPANNGDFAFANSDMAFSGNRLFMGSYHGVQVFDISNPRTPAVVATIACPGGQGDVSVYRNLLFLSVEETRGRLDCGAQGVRDTVSTERFRGVRIFDISDVRNPRQVASVQTCRGSHTHTLVPDPRDPANLYVYVSGTSQVRSPSELAGCSGRRPSEDPNTSYFRIEVIQVPVARPQEARIVSMPRVFANAEGSPAGLWQGGNHGEGTQTTAQTNQCHDITVYPQMGLAAGACSGNGILMDIRDPANPVRIDQVSDPNFAYWHSATFNNDGTKVLFSDEWGGGTAPRCRDTDRPEWGADAIFTLTNRKLTQVGYYKLPAAQTALENCVAHNGSLIPVPGRDIQVQSWYQGGISIVDFTDGARPVEIAFFDRGPQDANQMLIGGYWSSYWYNGNIYGSEIGRGLDVFQLKPSDMLSQNEIDAAKLVTFREFNPQNQQRLEWPAAFVVARAYVDQLARGNALVPSRLTAIRTSLSRAERMSGATRRTALNTLATSLDRDVARAADPERVRMLSAAVRQLATARTTR
ncbi:LVIVD repeat-containing protein [Longimicrobium terrae]|uniref:DUF305 domain-containing protein n=1 Tax=Longimicrobium terrae TaxID=1639882 RepID=A0A841H2Z2_9BACT|nr:hypothetical protein [Longimicrobium terrae]MBB4637781.1 hypothetical protein [Longimicrobium terrae]MBB6072363.1 hypothetical protein [Longimicrobium terrae]